MELALCSKVMGFMNSKLVCMHPQGRGVCGRERQLVAWPCTVLNIAIRHGKCLKVISTVTV